MMEALIIYSLRGRKLFEDGPSDEPARGLKSASYKLLHFILDSSMYMLLITGIIPHDEFQKLFVVPDADFDSFFQQSIAFDLRKLQGIVLALVLLE